MLRERPLHVLAHHGRAVLGAALQRLNHARGSRRVAERIGYGRWLRNIAVALGNAPTSPGVVESLQRRAEHGSPVVREHVQWALAQHASKVVDQPQAQIVD